MASILILMLKKVEKIRFCITELLKNKNGVSMLGESSCIYDMVIGIGARNNNYDVSKSH